MGLEQDAGAKFDNDLLFLKRGPKEQFDPLAKIGLRPLLWPVNTELVSAGKVTLAIRRHALKALLKSDFERENCQLKLFGKCYAAA